MAKSRARKLADIIVGAGIDIDGNLTFDGGSTSADLTFADNDKANFGDASDLQIYHTGSSSVIRENGPGTFYIQGTDIVMTDSAGAERYADFTFDGASRLYHDNSVKFATTSTGIDVTGSVVSDGLTVDGAATIGSSTAKTKFYSDSTYNGIYNGSSLTSDESIYMGGDTMFFYASGKKRLDINAGGDISFYEDTGTDAKFFWDASTESLGIGTTSPSRPLDVLKSGSSGYIAKFRTSTNALNVYDAGNAANGIGIGTESGQSLRLFTNDTLASGITVDSSGNVGIGTTSPDGKLDVAGNVYLANYSGTGENQTILAQNNYGQMRAGIRSGVPYIGSITSLDFALYTGNSEKVRIDTSGNVGIGTTSPGTSLHIANSSNSFLTLERTSPASGTGKFGINIEGTSQATFAYDNSSKIVIGRSSNPQTQAGFSNDFVFDSSGNFGIGTTAPAYKLQVNGSGIVARFTDGTSHMDLYSGSNLTEISTVNPLLFSVGSTERMRIDSSGNLIMTAGGTIRAGGVNDLILDAGESGTPDIYLQSGGSTKIKIEGSNGNVGIGTTFPSNTLHINAGNIVNPNSTGSEITSATLALGTNIHLEERQVNGAYSDRTDLAIVTNTGFGIGESEKIRIQASGNVGIGTTSPSFSAVNSVSSGIKGIEIFKNGTDTASALKLAGDNGSGTKAFAQVGYSGANATAHFANYNTSGTKVGEIVIGSTGNVGIGTTSPGTELHVTSAGNNTYSSTVTKGTNHTGLSIVQEGGNTDMTGVFFGSGGSGTGSHWSAITGSRTNHSAHWGTQLNFYTHANNTSNLADATQKMIITGDGNVGIGTTSPAATLDIAGTTKITSSTSMLLTLNPTANNYGGILYQYGGATKGAAIYNSGLMNFGGESEVSTVLQAGGQYGLFIHHSTRNVGIGTGASAPGQKLTVAGGHIKLDEGYSLQWSDSYERIEQSDGHLEFFVNNGESMTLDTYGLGIGTTAPQGRLHVAQSKGSAGNLWTQVGAGNAPSIHIQNTANVANTNAAIYFRNSVGEKASIGARFVNQSTGETHLRFSTTSSSGSTFERLVLDGDGNVGIGTLSPSTSLDIERSSGNATQLVNATANNTRATIETKAKTSGGVEVRGVLGSYGDATKVDIGTLSNHNLSILTNNTERVRFMASGNVGIGTTNPFAKLQVAGSELFMHGGSTTTGPGIFLGDNNFANSSYYNSAPGIGAVGPYGGVTAGLAFYIYGSQANSRNEAMRIDSSGNVGINEAIPSGRLHITEGNNYAKFGDFHSNSTMTLQMADSTAFPVEIQAYSSELRFNTTSSSGATPSTKMLINYLGNVGIGTTNPSSKLEVNNPSGAGNGSAQEVGRFVNSASGASSMYLYLGASAGVDWRLGKNVTGISGNANFSIANHSGTRMLDLTSDGHLALGITDPSNPKHRKVEVTATTAVTSTAWSTNTGNNGGYDVKSDDSSTYSNYGSVTVAGVYNKHVAEWEMHGNMSANTWYPVATMSQLMAWQDQTGSSQISGFSMYFRIYAYDVGAGGPTYLSSAMTERIWVNGYTSNSTQEHRIHVGPWIGHAPNHSPTLYSTSQHYQLRIHHHLSSETYYASQPVLEILVTSARTGLDGAGSKVLNIYGYVG